MIKNDERTILVTGATGTVGSEVVKQLYLQVKKNIIIRAAVHSQNKADKFKVDNKTVVDIVNIDDKPETIADALNNVDKLFLVTVHAPNIVAADITSSFVKEAKKNGGDELSFILFPISIYLYLSFVLG
jgi:uncharacterized protein YbjT (DUF2867 family)